MKPFFRSLALWMLIGVILMMLFQLYSESGKDSKPMAYSDFLSSVEQGRVTKVEIRGADVKGELTDQTQFQTVRPDDPDLFRTLRAAKVSVEVVPERQNPLLWSILTSAIPVILLIAVWIFFMRQMQGGGKAMTFGKSRARLLTKDESKVTFADVAGIDEAKEELQEIVEFLKDPEEVHQARRAHPQGGAPHGRRRAPARRCWPRPSRARRACPSSPSPAPTSWRCSWASARAACATSSSRARRTPPASSSSTRSTRWAATGAPAWAAATTSASRP